MTENSTCVVNATVPIYVITGNILALSPSFTILHVCLKHVKTAKLSLNLRFTLETFAETGCLWPSAKANRIGPQLQQFIHLVLPRKLHLRSSQFNRLANIKQSLTRSVWR